MKIPLTPPSFKKSLKSAVLKDTIEFLSSVSGVVGVTTAKNEYLHWDKLRHLQPPEGLTPENWWFAMKFARMTLYKALPFIDKHGKPFVLATPDVVLKDLHSIDRNTGNSIQSPAPLLNTQMRDTYLVQSLIEEAITSSQLEGASTTRKVAKEMLRSKRKPRDVSEKMIFNNYQAMQFVREMKDENLTTELILELHRILTKDTLEDPKAAGEFRKAEDNINVVDNRDNQILHIPPKADELKIRLEKLCKFANESEEKNKFFMHPVIRAILLHFMLAYDHPFVDGNGRTARALFYWSMAHQGYWLMEFISISEVIKREPSRYAKAYLYTETDENDTTYFVLHQLGVILKAIKSLYSYLNDQSKQINQTEQLLHANQELQDKLNYRQIALIKHSLKHPNERYTIEGHRASHNVTYDTARNDLLNLAKLKLLTKQKIGKAFVFIAPKNLQKLLETS